MATVERSVPLNVGSPEAFSYFCEARSLATVFAADRANVVAQPDGPFELFFSSGDSTEGCTITDFDAGRLIVAQFTPPAHLQGADVAAAAVVSLQVDGDADTSTVQIRHEFEGGEQTVDYFEKRWDEWSHNLQVLAASDAGPTVDATLADGRARFDLSAVELSRIPNLVAPMMRNVEDQV